MEKIIDTVNKKAVEDMKEESPYTAFKSEKNLERAEAMEEKAAASKGEKEESLLKTTFPTRKRKTSSVPAASSRMKSNKNNQ